MGLLEGLGRAIASAIEATFRTAQGFFDFDSDDPLLGLDIGTLGLTRVVRKASTAIQETAENVVDDFES